MNRTKITLLIVGLAILGAILILPAASECSWDFMHSVWGPADLLVAGQPPYQLHPYYGPFVAPWWPQIIGFNFWMGWLPCQLSARLWLAVELIGFAAAAWLLNDRRKPLPWQVGVMALFFFLFPPLFMHIQLGQFSLLFAAMMVWLVFSPADGFPPARMPWHLALLVVLGAAKPQLCVLIYPALLALTIRQHGWRGALRLAGMCLAVLALCLVPLFLFYPAWVSGFLDVTHYNLAAGFNLPTPFIQLFIRFGTAGIFYWLPIFLACLGISLYLWLKKGAQVGMLWSMALTPIATLYASSWDFVLLLPLFFWMLLHFRRAGSRAALILGTLLAYVLQILPRLGNTDLHDGSQWWVPPVMVAVYALVWMLEHWLAHDKDGAVRAD